MSEKNVEETHPQILIGPPKLTRFEKARIVGARALQISMGAPILIERPTKITSPIELALKEVELKILPITVRRRLPDDSYQDIPIQWLIWDKNKAS